MGNKNQILAPNQNHHHDPRIMAMAGRFRVPQKITQQKAWQQLNLKEGRHITLFKSVMKIAATVAVFAIAAFAIYKFQHVQISTLRAEHKTVTLPDNSSILLNAESSVSYNKLLWTISRTVNFEGEGFFEVEKGSRFKVLSPQGSTTVLGTSFNVVARESRYKVACIHGRVSVAPAGGNSTVVLTAGLNTQTLQDHSLSAPTTYDKHELAWQEGEFYFSNASLPTVIETLERQYDIKIKVNASKNRLYTGYFTNKDLHEALKLVCLPLGLDFKIIQAGEIIIFNK